MTRTMKRLALPLGAAAILGTSGFAFMASNSVAPSYAGDGVNTVSGFSITNISYHQASGDLTYVNFDADPGATHNSSNDPAESQITFDGTNWINCNRTSLDRSQTPEAHFLCDVRGLGIHDSVSNLRVVVTH